MEAITSTDINLEQTSAVIFDLDGTLYDKHGFVRRIILSQLLYIGILGSERTTRKKLKGQDFGTAEKFYDAFFVAMSQGHIFSAKLARWWYFKRYMPAMAHILRRHYKAESWAQMLIAECNQKHIPVCVYSDYGGVEAKLQALGYDLSQFALIASAPDFGGLKPCKASAERLLAKLGVAAASSAMIGDRDDTDGASARAVGMRFIQVKTEK